MGTLAQGAPSSLRGSPQAAGKLDKRDELISRVSLQGMQTRSERVSLLGLLCWRLSIRLDGHVAQKPNPYTFIWLRSHDSILIRDAMRSPGTTSDSVS